MNGGPRASGAHRTFPYLENRSFLDASRHGSRDTVAVAGAPVKEATERGKSRHRGDFTWLGHTWYTHPCKPRLAIGFDYASGDGDSNCVTPGGNLARSCGGNANTFENFFPTNFLHVGYMLNGAWRNTVQPQVNIQARPTGRDHIEIWALRKYLASARDNWYRGSQGPLIFSRSDNQANHVGDEVDFAWSHMFADGKVSLAVIYGHFFSGTLYPPPARRLRRSELGHHTTVDKFLIRHATRNSEF